MSQQFSLTVRLQSGQTAAAARDLLAQASQAEWMLTVEFALAVLSFQEQLAAQMFRLEVDRVGAVSIVLDRERHQAN